MTPEEHDLLQGVYESAAIWRELALDLNGRAVEFALQRKLDYFVKGANEADWPTALQNLIGACATLAAYALANGRYAAMATMRADKLADQVQLLKEAC